jgi:hypothetical protein
VKAGEDFAALAKADLAGSRQRRQRRRPRLLPPGPDGGPFNDVAFKLPPAR